MIYDCIIVGGGAAGCFAAANLMNTKPFIKVLLLEKSSKLLSKVKISGGGRCNVTHQFIDVDSFAANYPRGERFMRKILHHFSPSDTVQWFESKGVALKTEADGRIFPVSNQSQEVIDCLIQAMNGVEIKYNQLVMDIIIHNEFKLIKTPDCTFAAKHIILATGGGTGHRPFSFLQKLNLNITPLVPSLFSFNFSPHVFKDLMGISISNLKIKIAGTKLTGYGPAVITHWGISGPAVLRLSAFGAYEMAKRNYKFTVLINWLPEWNENEIFQMLKQQRCDSPIKKITSKPFLQIPERLWLRLLKLSGISNSVTWSSASDASLKKLSRILSSMEVTVNGKTTYKEEFVTAGGVELSEIIHTTCELKKYPGIYLAGEMLNTDGVTGGFNFQNAWSTAFLCAKAVSEKC